MLDPKIYFLKIELVFAPEIMKKTLSKVALIIVPSIFFSVLPIGSKLAQILDILHRNRPERDFSIMTLDRISIIQCNVQYIVSALYIVVFVRKFVFTKKEKVYPVSKKSLSHFMWVTNLSFGLPLCKSPKEYVDTLSLHSLLHIILEKEYPVKTWHTKI